MIIKPHCTQVSWKNVTLLKVESFNVFQLQQKQEKYNKPHNVNDEFYTDDTKFFAIYSTVVF